MLFNDTQLSGKWGGGGGGGGGGGKGEVIILQGGVRIFQPPLQDTDPPVSNLGESLSRATPDKIFKLKVTTARSNQGQTMTLHTYTPNQSPCHV